MLLKNKFDKVKTFVNTDSVLSELEERYCYAKDAYCFDSDSKIPDIVLFVETIDEVQKVVKFANEHKIPIVCRGAGTNMVGACVCSSGGIVLNFSKMNRILEINSVNMTARVQPGVVLGDLKQAVENLNLFYPPDPSNFRVSTIGGSIAQSSGGAKAFKYGTTKDYVLSLKVVTADGSLMTLGAETVKDASGYHLAQLMIGSEGTLAVVVEATLKLIPKPEARQVVLAYFKKTKDALDSVNSILTSNIFPAAIEFMDKNSIITIEEFLSCGLNIDNEAMLLIELDGLESSMSEQIVKLKNALTLSSEIRIAETDEEAELIWKARRASFAATSRLAPEVISDDIIVPRENLLKMVEKCNQICSGYNLKLCLVGHAGDGNLHPQIALNLENEEEFQNCIKAKSEIYQAAIELGGALSSEHGIGIEKLPYLENTVDRKSMEYMKLIKQMFDSNNIFNPGKIFKI